MSGDDESVPAGVCTAPRCKCSCFYPKDGAPMYCGQPKCDHSVEWHHLPAKEIEA